MFGSQETTSEIAKWLPLGQTQLKLHFVWAIVYRNYFCLFHKSVEEETITEQKGFKSSNYQAQCVDFV